MSSAIQQPCPALWVSTIALGEADALVRFFVDSDGAIAARARGLQKATSKLAHTIQPADELNIRLARGRGQTQALIGVTTTKSRPHWRDDLGLLAFYWFMVECAFFGTGTEQLNSAVFTLLTETLSTKPANTQHWACITAFSLKLLKLHGLLCDFDHCVRDGQDLKPSEPVFLLPSGEGFISCKAYNKYYARTGSQLLRLTPDVLPRWRIILHRPTSQTLAINANSIDAAVAIHLVKHQISQAAGCPVNSAAFLLRQWALPSIAELLRQSLATS